MIDAVIITNIIVLDKICHVNYQSAAEFKFVMTNKYITFTKEYGGPTLRPPCVITMKNTFSDIISDDLLSDQIEAVSNILSF